MKVFLVFLKKEFLGGLRSKKLLICLILFALIGMLSLYRENHARFDGQHDARID